MIELVRITKVGGRYLVFEVKDVASLRRDHCICAVFIGTTPQNPTQNVFSGLPIELLAEEAKLLVEKGAAYIVDDAVSHLNHLSSMDSAAKQAYLQSLKTRRQNISRVLNEQDAARKREGAKMRAKQKSKRAPARGDTPPVDEAAILPPTTSAEKEDEAVPPSTGLTDLDSSLFSHSPHKQESPSVSKALANTKSRHITPTTSIDMLLDPRAHTVPIEAPRSYPFYKHLNSRGFYITPGIRFGADYSVYPGDPFRYHAHFMATSFEWDEEITMLDIVSGGRLGTGVKKGFLIGGQAPPDKSGGSEEDSGEDRVRAFTIEWAAM
ncbi:putative tRNA-splicing endonuclease subunit tsp-4 [Cytospora mali]|uniref:tRNA-splicing endonuclease subunit Sen34 n=1 Tax=Cytospora mali TaxID=578113 RepID=A0A194UU34_CYTMA|nr:putative tRNA-splicing endonuclease subunit tsp-4 [Valsa mali var. pyri (nom. inval.)]